jgi:manganese/zinc/iron transport system substrate-binding protein
MLWKEAVQIIANTLQQTDTVNAKFYKTNTTAYLQQLDSLDAFVRKELQAITENQRVLITAHDAFGYFGKAYNVDVHGLQGISTVSEFGLNDVKELTDFIISKKIKAIFVESSVSERSILAVVEGCRSKNWPVTIGGSLFSDAMGDANTPEGTYIGIVKHNASTIANALK